MMMQLFFKLFVQLDVSLICNASLLLGQEDVKQLLHSVTLGVHRGHICVNVHTALFRCKKQHCEAHSLLDAHVARVHRVQHRACHVIKTVL
jgi:hypothetical protein